MKIAYHFNVHHDPRQFSWLFNAVYNPHDYFSIHIDRRADPETARGFFDIIRGLPNVHATRRISVRWGGWSICQSELISLRDMLRRYSDWSYFTVLSGFDYPLRPREEIVAYLEQRRDANFIQGAPIAEMGLEIRSRHKRMYFEVGDEVRSFRIPYLRRPPYPLRLKGSGWHVITRPFSEWLLSDPVARRCRSYRFRLYSRRDVDAGPDREQPVPIELGERRSSRDRVEESPDTPGAHKAHPEILTRNHLGLLETSRAFFARKFDRTIDSDVLHRLARRIGVAPAE